MAEAGTVETQGAHAHDADHGHHEQSFVSKYIFSTDHKIIGLQYMFTGIVMALIGGYMSYAIRMRLPIPSWKGLVTTMCFAIPPGIPCTMPLLGYIMWNTS